MNEKIDNDTQLTAALFGELSAEAADAIATAQPEAMAEMQAVVDALQADLPDSAAPLSDDRRQSVLALAAELDAALAIVPAAEPPPMIETNWFRQQLPMMVAAALMLGAGVASFVLLKQPQLDEMASVRADGPPPPATEMASESEMAAGPQVADLIVEADAHVGDLAFNAANAETVLVADAESGQGGVELTAAVPESAVPDVVATAAPFAEAPMPKPAIETAEEDLADLDSVAEEAPAADTPLALAQAPLRASADLARSKPKRRMEAASARKGKVDVRESVALALETEAADDGDSVAFSALPAIAEPPAPAAAPGPPIKAAPVAPGAPAVSAFAVDAAADSAPVIQAAAASGEQAAKAVRGRTKPLEKSMPQALGAQTVHVEHAPSPVHRDRLLLVVSGGDPSLRFDEALVLSHRKLAPGVYEVTLRADAKRGAFASVVIDDVIVPVAIEAGKAAFDHASVPYRMAVLKALNIAAPADAAGGVPAND